MPTSTVAVACNVYISEGRSKEIVLDLLDSFLSSNSEGLSSRLVHVVRDVRYNRSSFHFVGTALAITSTVAPFCWKAWSVLESRARSSGRSIEDNNDVTSSPFHLKSTTDHPAVGYIDHIAVLPLRPTIGNHCENGIATTKAAMEIGKYLEDHRQDSTRMKVLYYSLASPTHMSLAETRRHHTNFFQRSAMSTPTVTVGAPGMFVENWNVRLKCERSVAKTLTKRLRDRLQQLEALTLAYDENVFEVACNIINANDEDGNADPTEETIAKEVAEWSKEHTEAEVLRQYRVGTTARQCREVWEATDSVYQTHAASLRSMIRDQDEPSPRQE